MAEEFGILQGAASLTLTICNICVALGGLATRKLTKLVPWRVLIVACTAILGASTAGIAISPKISLAYVLSATRGLAGGIIGFVLVTYVLNKWFVAQLGLMTSIAMGCSGLAGAIFTPIIQPVVTAFGWRVGQLLVAALTLACCLPAILTVPSCDPRDIGLVPFGASPSDGAPSVGARKPPVKVNGLVAAAVVLYAILSAAVSAMPQHFPGFAEEVGLTVGVGAAMISASMVANTAGKIFMGWLCDRVGAKASIMAYTILVCVSIAALLLVHIPVAFVAAAFLFGLCYSRATVGLTMMCREVFGKRGFGIVYPVAALGCSFSNAVFSSAVGFGYDLTGGYTVSLVAFLIFLVGSAAVVWWCYANAKGAVKSA
jgi:MFS family permease